MTERLLSVAEIAQWLGVSPTWVRHHASGQARPYLPAIRVGGLLRFRREDIEAWLREQQIAA
jgi:excisionase family DNA binding protein